MPPELTLFILRSSSLPNEGDKTDESDDDDDDDDDYDVDRFLSTNDGDDASGAHSLHLPTPKITHHMMTKLRTGHE